MTLGRTAYQTNRLGALAPRYAFILNPYVDSRFTRCARCETKTNLRKLSLVIHVNGFGLVLLGKTCRLCLRCDTLVAHKAELDDLLRTVVNVPEPDYVVLGTIDRHVYRRGLSGDASLVLTLVPGAVALLLVIVVFALPRSKGSVERVPAGRVRDALASARTYLRDGVGASAELLRSGDRLVIAGAIGYFLFDVSALAAAFHAVGSAAPVAASTASFIARIAAAVWPISSRP